ncbi:MAG: Holliday junction branch migration DNA helicase RuvB [Spirochaetaceae bacterium]|jgi:Holliday junction DNA helicase RuvB|nr:Holliday junction branch migration DNA helicase RuvB [Spirochaetaceae bacterium]
MAKKNPHEREADPIVHSEVALPDDERDRALRPLSMEEFLGQKEMKDNLAVFIKAARERGESLDHVFLTGPPGLGKTTLAHIVANEMGVDFVETSAPALDKPKDLVGILTNLKPKAVFFIDEVHRLKPAIEEMLYIAMEDYELDWIIGQGPAARTMRLPIRPFTLAAATTKAGMVSSPLVSRFGITCHFSLYESADIAAIIRRSAAIMNITIDDEAVALLARSSRFTPRVTNRLLRRMRDFAQVSEKTGLITLDVVRFGLSRLQIDDLGLEKQDRDILKMIIQRYGGGPVGAETLAISVGDSADTLEDFYEPYLIQAGLMERTSRGRMATSFAYEHLGLHEARPRNEDNRLLF